MISPSPLFSIVIPTYNRPHALGCCLQALLQLEYERDRFEVIVVDDGGTLSLQSMLAPAQEQLQLTLIEQPNAGPASARNQGAALAQGQFLVFTDDDCQPAADWLTVLESHCLETPDALIGGLTINALPNNLFSTASQVLIDYLYSYYNDDHTQALFFASNNMAVPTRQFRELGQFDTSFPLAAGEDREFCDRWHHHRYPLRYVPEARVYHAHQLTLRRFWRQHFNYGQGAFYFHQRRAQRGAGSIQVEPLSFYLKLLTYPLTQCTSQPGILLAMLFLLSQVANVAGFFWIRSQTQPTPTALP
jgi:glycosyltransferase involved in cell wall biosynthesis